MSSDLIMKLENLSKRPHSHRFWEITEIVNEALSVIPREETMNKENLSEFLGALDDWGCNDNDIRAAEILAFQKGGYDLAAYEVPNDECDQDPLLDALRAIAAPRDCGCAPSCQCNSQESLEIEVDALRDIARAALTPPKTSPEPSDPRPSPMKEDAE